MKFAMLGFFYLIFTVNASAFYHEMSKSECLSMADNNEDGIALCNYIEEVKAKNPQQTVSNRYAKDGHLYTTFIVLRAAGVEENSSYDIAYCSQLPDDNAWFSASLASFNPNIEYRNNIMGVIHSLHGGNAEDVNARRKALKTLIIESLKKKNLSNCEVGILIHAYADSYAHTYRKGNKEKAYGLFLGHLLHGHRPDVIAYDSDKYIMYSNEFFNIFKRNAAENLPDEFITNAKELSKNRQRALIKMEDFALNNYNYDTNKMDCYKEKWKKEVTKDDMDKLIYYIKNNI